LKPAFKGTSLIERADAGYFLRLSGCANFLVPWETGTCTDILLLRPSTMTAKIVSQKRTNELNWLVWFAKNKSFFESRNDRPGITIEMGFEPTRAEHNG
jgi:hypothetical protein